MKRWKGTVVVSYTQEIEVEAQTQDEAEMKMYEAFDQSKVTYSSECQAYDVEEVRDSLTNQPTEKQTC